MNHKSLSKIWKMLCGKNFRHGFVEWFALNPDWQLHKYFRGTENHLFDYRTTCPIMVEIVKTARISANFSIPSYFETRGVATTIVTCNCKTEIILNHQ